MAMISKKKPPKPSPSGEFMLLKPISMPSIGKFLSVIMLLSMVFIGLAPQSALGSTPNSPTFVAGDKVYLRLNNAPDAFSYVAPPAQVLRESPPQTATINVTYTGFTPEPQAAFQFAVDIWQTLLTSNVTIEVNANWEALPDGVLGGARPETFIGNFTNAPRTDTFYPIAIANKLAGEDLVPAQADIGATFSSVVDNWYFGTDGNTPAGQIDFVSVVLHELGHGLGFSGSENLENGQGSLGFGTNSFPSIYDVFVQNGAGAAITSFPNPSAELLAQFQSGELFFNSPNAVAANNGNPPQLYAPAVFEPGSSYSHLDEDVFGVGDANSLMTPGIGPAEAIHHPGAITLGMFTDMGWTTEPTAVTVSSVDVASNSMPLALLAGMALMTLGLAALWQKRG
jgi:hypothetical protein